MPRPILKKIDLAKLINKSLEFIKMTSNNKIDLKNFFIPLINGDEDQLNRVFLNLIKNSEESFLKNQKKTLILKVL